MGSVFGYGYHDGIRLHLESLLCVRVCAGQDGK
jgi:hypothetical protein